ncbi:hypothetical protein NOR_01198 [Metarhizium rileyi]|uniref:Uncharacterized protein n=1 Tax=Metarhizium rileyi (strain RCEF 4871) TaxID=1649241 RepID=A0A167IP13_METRR|nr:hypothetical protein NOR_01198 [Metarhizium rileyi RCEF 4871]TWU77841.1 hypothetical protein ED733_002816 [Metarhizium rileyi]
MQAIAHLFVGDLDDPAMTRSRLAIYLGSSTTMATGSAVVADLTTPAGRKVVGNVFIPPPAHRMSNGAAKEDVAFSVLQERR